MSRKDPNRIPSYRLHRQSGQAIVTLTDPQRRRRDFLLGPHGSEESHERYRRLIAAWLEAGRRLPLNGNARGNGDDAPRINDLLAAFWRHVQDYYRKPDGTPTSEREQYRQAMRPLRRLYGTSPAAEFDVAALELVRGEMLRLGWSRRHINKQVNRVRHVFKWAGKKKLAPAGVWHELQLLDPLKLGRSEARETEAVKPVPEHLIEAVRPHVSRQVWALIQLQLRTGARADELVDLRPCDIDRSGKVWLYSPDEHKTAHHGHTRRIYFGPEAQKILAPFLADRAPGAYLFSPREAEAERHAAAETHRRPGQKPTARRTPHGAPAGGPLHHHDIPQGHPVRLRSRLPPAR